MLCRMTLTGDPVNHSEAVLVGFKRLQLKFAFFFQFDDTIAWDTTTLECTVCTSLSRHCFIITFLPSPSLRSRCPQAVATPIVQESTALRIVLASSLARREAFA